MGLDRSLLAVGSLDRIGGTPLIRLRRVAPEAAGWVLVKLENANPGGRSLDRVALAAVEAAELAGELRPGGSLVAVARGGAGEALAWIGAARGYRVALTLPADRAAERPLLERYGAEVVVTPAEAGATRAREAADRRLAEQPAAFRPRLDDETFTAEIHARTTAEEIWRQTSGRIDAFVAPADAVGLLAGVGGLLGSRLTAVRLIEAACAEREAEREAGADRAHCDERIVVSEADARAMAGRLAREEGLLAGPVSGACVWAAAQVARRLGRGRVVVTVLDDTWRWRRSEE